MGCPCVILRRHYLVTPYPQNIRGGPAFRYRFPIVTKLRAHNGQILFDYLA